MRKIGYALGAASCLLAAAPLAASAQEPEKPGQLAILSGSTGASWYAYATGMIPIFQEAGITATTIPGGGSSNPLRLSARETDAAFGQTSANYDAQQAQGAFEGQEPITNLRNLALLSVDHVHVVCVADAGIASWEQLPEARFAAPAVTTSSWGNFVAGLEAHGMTPEDLNIVIRANLQDNMTALRDREADCTSHTSAWPVAPISEVANSIDLTFIPMAADKIEAVQAINPGLLAGEIPVEAYPGMTEPVPVFMAGSVLMAHDELPDATAYWIVKVIADNAEAVRGIHEGLSSFDPAMMVDAPVWEMHPGAQQFYDEAGFSAQ